MKYAKIILSSLAIVMMFCIGCSKKSDSNITDTELLSNATKQSITSNSLVALKQSYALLSNSEKQTLWDIKWNAILKNDASKLTLEQKKIIIMIKTFVDKKTIAALMKDPIEGETFIKNNLPYFEQNFTKPQLYLIIECPYFCDNFTIDKSMDYLKQIDKTIGNPESNYITYSDGDAELEPIDGEGAACTCRYTIYCAFGGGGGGTCNTGSCGTTSSCGLAGTSHCTGRCG